VPIASEALERMTGWKKSATSSIAEGFGIAFVPEDLARSHVMKGSARTKHGAPRQSSAYRSQHLSHTIKELEARLGVRLLTRTTRSVSPTDAGERLLHNIAPRFEEIEAEVAALRELREKPAGTIRLTAGAASSLIGRKHDLPGFTLQNCGVWTSQPPYE
jgi:hypothetical protein